MVEAIEKELTLTKNYFAEKVETIYFGGGTPSLLSDIQLKKILLQVYTHFEVVDKAEVTIEANPEDLISEKCSSLFSLGFNRISIGIQTFDDKVLTFLNRNHSADLARQAIVNARAAGFENINIDLIYGIPQQSFDLWKENLQKAIAYKPNHISAYALTIEPKTAFGNWQKKGLFTEVVEDDVASQFEIMVKMMENAGYRQYEVSNFALPGFESRHNSSYWQGTPYLGLGPGAHSFNLKSRQFNISNNAMYIKALSKNKLPYELEELSTTDQLSEYLFTHLRTRTGINLKEINEKYHYDIRVVHGVLIDQLVHNEKAILANEKIIMTTE